MNTATRAAPWIVGTLLAAALAASAATPTAGGGSDSGAARNRTCAGFPRVELQTPPGYCVASVADASHGLRFPRRMVEVAPGRYWLVDMGSWEPHRGRLLELSIRDETAPGPRVSVQVLADRLDRPHGLAKGPDGMVYVGEAGKVWRSRVAAPIAPTSPPMSAPQTVVDGLPADGAHPLKEIVFGAAGQLFINIGSATDACRDDAGRATIPCPELVGARPRAAVYLATLGGPGNTLQSLRPWATGLRNSVALAFVSVNPQGRAAPRPPPVGDQKTWGGPAFSGEHAVLLQGENSIDYPDAADPPEELNVLRDGKHYGWPYCVGARRAARAFEGRFDCKTTESPAMLWPAHVAPLQMLAVPAAPSASPFAGQLLVAWHGHRPAGHRVVGFALDAQGNASGAPRAWVSGWQALPGVRPQGAPTGLLLDSADRLFILEDRNRNVLMLVRDATAGPPSPSR